MVGIQYLPLVMSHDIASLLYPAPLLVRLNCEITKKKI